MRRFLIAILLLLTVSPAMAQEWDYRNPPLAGDMERLRPLPDPVYLPNDVVLQTRGEELVYLRDLARGKFVIVNFWATWCPPCISELPSLNALNEAMKSDKFEVITVSMDNMPIDEIALFIKKNNLTTLEPYLNDEKKGMARLSVMQELTGLPATLFIDNQMRVFAVFEGDADWNGHDARAVIDYYLKTMPGMQ